VSVTTRRLTNRLQELEKAFAPVLRTDPWGSMACYRDEVLQLANQRGDFEETKKHLDEIGPTGFYMEIVRHHLRPHGIEQLPNESFHVMLCRAMGYSGDQLKQCIQEGHLGKELVRRFGAETVADNAC